MRKKWDDLCWHVWKWCYLTKEAVYNHYWPIDAVDWILIIILVILCLCIVAWYGLLAYLVFKVAQFIGSLY